MNQVFLGTSDPFLGMDQNIASRLQALQQYEQAMKQAAPTQPVVKQDLIWDKINTELSSLTDSQRKRLAESEEYVEVSTCVEQLVQQELVNLVKSKIENAKDGKDLLNKQYDLVKRLKVKIVADTDNEMLLFKQFREYSKTNPNATYEDFYKEWQNTSTS